MSVREEIELDITSALSSIDRVGESLASVASTFQTSVEEALSSLSGATTIDVSATVETDVESVAPTVEAAVTEGVDAANTTVTPEADTAPMASEIENAATDTTVTIEVDADTTQAQEQIDGLTQSTDSASSSLDTLGGTSDSFSAAAGIAGGSASGLESAVGGISPATGAAAGGLAALSGLTSQFFDSAVNATSANDRFQQSFGVLADNVKQVNVGDLDVDLAKLDSQLGSSTTQVKNVVSTFAQLGDAAGASKEQVAESSDQLVALSARAVALNPNLGSVGDVATRMQTALARGGRFAAQFGLDLTSADINARALNDTGKTSVAQLSQYEKAAAGAAIATDKYGTSLKEDIAQGAQNPILQLKSLTLEFAKAGTEIGKPLIAPVFDLLRSAVPIAISFAQVFGNLAAAVIPSVTAVLQGLGPPIDAISGIFAQVAGSVGPALANVFVALVGAAKPTLDIFTAILPTVVPFADGLATLVQGVTDLFTALGPIPGILGVVAAAWVAFTFLLDVNPVFLVITALVTLVGVIKEHNGVTEDAPVNMQKFSDSLFGEAKSAQELTDKLAELNKNSKDYLATQSEFAKTGTTTSLLKVEDLDAVNQQIQQGAQGLEAFTAAAIQAGQVKIKIDGVEQSAEQVKALNGTLGGLLSSEKAEVSQGKELVGAFNTELVARENASHAKLDELTATGQITAAQRDEVVARTNAEGSVHSYSNALQLAIQLQNQNTQAQQAADPPLATNASNWTALEVAVANGSLTLGTAKDAADKFGVSADQMNKFITESQTAIDNLVNAALQKLPSVGSVFDALTTKSSPTLLTQNLNAATFQILLFGVNLENIRAQGFDKVADFLRTQGPEAAGAFSQAFLNATDDQKKALQESITTNENARKAYGDDTRNDIANSTEASKTFAENATKGFNDGLHFDQVTAESLDAAKAKLTGAGLDDFKKTASDGGSETGAALAQGLQDGLVKGFPGLEQQAREAIKRMQAAANDEAGIHSPSRLFAEIGSQLSAGVAVGLDEGTPQVVAAAEQIIRDAATATASQTLGVPATSVTGPVGGGTAASSGSDQPLIGQMIVQVEAGPGVTEQQAREVGTAVADGAAARLSQIRAKVFSS